jgi:dienelactone hydrolase
VLGCVALGCLPVPAAGPATEAPEPGPPPVVELWPGKGPAALYQVGEIRAFELNQGEGLRGVSWGRYEGPLAEQPQHHRFTTRVELLLPGRAPLRSDGEIIVDAAGELIRGFERSDAARLDFERQGDLLILSAGRQREELKFTRGTAYMAFGALLHEELMLGLRSLRVGEASWRLVSLSGALPTEWSAQISREDGPGGGAARLSTSLGESILFAGGRILSIDVEDDGLRVRPSEAAWPAWEIAGPRALRYSPAADASFSARPVELPGRPGEPRLVGELLIPRAAAAGPRPGVILLAGNGRQDRYGFAGPPPVDLGSHAITDAIAEAGFVVLRFDERGQGESDDGPLSYEGQLEDARRALRTLMVQAEVDPARIALVGHGESGWRAMQLAGEDRGVAAVALLATPGRPYGALLDAQAELDIAAMPPAVREAARAQHQRLMTALRGSQALPAELAEQAQWLRELLLVEPARLIAGLRCPLWLAQGEKDFEVDPRRDAAALVEMARGQRLRPQLQRYPGLDHLFKPEAGSSTPARYLDPEGPRAVDPGFLADLTRWLAATLDPPKQPKRPARPR